MAEEYLRTIDSSGRIAVPRSWSDSLNGQGLLVMTLWVDSSLIITTRVKLQELEMQIDRSRTPTALLYRKIIAPAGPARINSQGRLTIPARFLHLFGARKVRLSAGLLLHSARDDDSGSTAFMPSEYLLKIEPVQG
jgi:DNA-binding transcriptional regulator/RsmH inhibitor MraZ